MAQTWHDLLGLHWPVPAASLRPHIPSDLRVQEREGSAWLGVFPFRMSGIRFRWLPPLPWLSSFPELNLRTYVTDGERPGVWFFSLDAARLPAVVVARRLWHLPYRWARMSCGREGGVVTYRSRVRTGGAEGGTFAATYRAIGPAAPAPPGSLREWWAERYCLYAADSRGRLLRGEIHHAPWDLRPADVEVRENTLTAPLDLDLDLSRPPVDAYFARRCEVVVWLPRRIRRGSPSSVR